MRSVLVLLALAVAVGCRREPEATKDAVAARVGHLLYEQNLISDPAVSSRLMIYAAEVGREGFPPDSVLPELHRWLETWAAAHPDRVARARLVPRAAAR